MRGGGVFSCEILDLSPGLAVLRFEGAGAKAAFAKEAGGHRWQRVPPTERHGRRQSSTITVAVLPEPAAHELKIASHDLRIETFRSGGSGGQHQNKTESGVRITHIPTGITASSREKSQHRNRELAMSEIRARVAQAASQRVTAGINSARKQQVGSGERSDKIRTIADQRARVENHLNGKRMSIERYMRGFLEDIH